MKSLVGLSLSYVRALLKPTKRKRVSARKLKELRRTLPKGLNLDKKDIMLPLYDKPDRILIVVSGGPGKHSAFMHTSHSARFTTKEIKLPANWKELLEKYKGWGTPWGP